MVGVSLVKLTVLVGIDRAHMARSALLLSDLEGMGQQPFERRAARHFRVFAQGRCAKLGEVGGESRHGVN